MVDSLESRIEEVIGRMQAIERGFDSKIEVMQAEKEQTVEHRMELEAVLRNWREDEDANA